MVSASLRRLTPRLRAVKLAMVAWPHPFAVLAVILLSASMLVAAEKEADETAEFSSGGVRVEARRGAPVSFHVAGESASGAQFSFELEGVVVGEVTLDTNQVEGPQLEDRRVIIPRGSVTEIYAGRPMGVEQLFRIDALPESASGDLHLSGRIKSDLELRWVGGPTMFELHKDGEVAFTYGSVTVRDAAGAEMHPEVFLDGSKLHVVIAGAWLNKARLPVVIDPLIGTSSTQLSTANGNSERSPNSAYSATQDTFIAVFEEVIAGNSQIRVRRYKSITTSISTSTPSDVSSGFFADNSTADTIDPRVGWSAAHDRYLIVWNNKTTKSIGGATFFAGTASVTSAGTAPPASITPTATIATAPSDILRLAVGGSDVNKWIVVYDEVDNAVTNVKGVILTSNPSAPFVTIGAPFLIAANAREAAVNKMSRNGTSWLVSYVTGAAGGNTNVSAAFVDANGTVGATIAVAGSADPEREPAIGGPVAGVSGSEWLVAYTIQRPAPRTDTDVRVARISAGGVNLLSIDAGDSVNEDERTPSVDSLADEYLVAWTRQTGTDLHVGGRRMFHDLRVIDAFPLFISTVVPSESPSVSARNKAGVVDEYITVFQSSVNSDIRARLLSGNFAPQLTNVYDRQFLAVAAIPTGTAAAAGSRSFDAADPGAGQTAPIDILLENGGLDTLFLTNVKISGAHPNDFTVTAVPNSIVAGAFSTFRVLFDPTDVGARNATVSFDHNGVGGQVSPFAFNVSGTGKPFTTRISTATAVSFSSSQAGDSTIHCPVNKAVLAVRVVGLNIFWNNNFYSGLNLSLIGPNGVSVNLYTFPSSGGPSGGNALVGTTFDDTSTTTVTSSASPLSGRLRPTQPLSTFRNVNAQGDWTLRAGSTSSSKSGEILSWTLVIDTPDGPYLLAYENSTSGQAILHNDPPVTGRIFPPQNAPTGPSTRRTIALENSGPIALNVTSVTLSTGTAFQIDPVGYTATIPANSTSSFDVVFDPAATGVFLDRVNVVHNGAGLPSPFQFEVRGIGLDAGPVTRTFTAASAPLGIPFAPAVNASTPTTLTSAIYCSLGGTVANVKVTGIDILHEAVGNIRVSIVSPGGDVVRLTNSFTNASDHWVNVSFDDAASRAWTTTAVNATPGGPAYTGVYRPVVPLANLAGVSANGFWSLKIENVTTITLGTLNSWGLEVTTNLEGPALPLFDLTDDATRQRVVNGEPPTDARHFGRQSIAVASAPLRMRIDNLGVGALTVSNLSIEGASASHFQIVNTSLPGVVPAFSSSFFDIRFQPTSPGPKLAQVRIEHNGTTTAATPFTFGVSGKGVPTGASIALTSTTITAIASLSTISLTAAVTQNVFVGDVEVEMSITHDRLEDLEIFLIHPDGSRVELSTDNGAQDNTMIGTRFSDDGFLSITEGISPFIGRFRPEGRLSSLAGKSALGDWTLEIRDDKSGDVGDLFSWTLDIVPISVGSPAITVREGGLDGTDVGSGSAPAGRRQFGLQTTGIATSPATFTVVNTGTTALTVQAPISAAGNTADFTIDGTNLPAVLASGASATFTAAFLPGATGVRSARIDIGHDGGLGATQPFEMRVTGVGASAFANPQTITATDVPTSIPDFDPRGGAVSVVSNLTGFVDDLDVIVHIEHETSLRQITLSLTGPDGTTMTLARKRGGIIDELYRTPTFDDEGPLDVVTGVQPFNGRYKPEEPLSLFDGRRAAGVWTLTVVDDDDIASGTIYRFEPVIRTSGVSRPIFKAYESSLTGPVIENDAPAAPESGRAFLVPVAAGTSGAPLSIVIENQGFDPLTVSSIAVTGTHSADFAVGAAGLVVSPGGSDAFTVAFAPTAGALGVRDATIEVVHNGPGRYNTPFRFQVRGRAMPSSMQTFVNNSIIPIPNFVSGVFPMLSTTSAVVVGGAGRVADVVVAVRATYRFATHLSVFLVHPDGTEVRLFSDVFGQDLDDSTFDDLATRRPEDLLPVSNENRFFGYFRPKQSLRSLIGKPAAGTWGLKVIDDNSGQTGSITAFRLYVAVEPDFPNLVVREQSTAGPVVLNGEAAFSGRSMGRQDVGAGAAQPLTLVLTNVGAADLVVGAPVMTGSSDFGVVGGAATIAAGGSTTYSVSFDPSGTGTSTATLTFAHDARFSTSNPFVVSLRGEGVGAFTVGSTVTLPSTDVPSFIASRAFGTKGSEASASVVSNLPGYVDDIDVRIAIPSGGATTANMRLFLIGPDGTMTPIALNRGSSYNDALFDASSTRTYPSSGALSGAAYKPDGDFNLFRGRAAAGLWTLLLLNAQANSTANITKFEVLIRTTTATPVFEVREGAATGRAMAVGAPRGGRIFPVTAVSSGSTLTAMVVNAGDAPLTVASVSVTGTGAGHFVVTQPAGPIASGSSESFTISYRPTTPGFHSATVTAVHNGVGTGTSAFEVIGRALVSPVLVAGGGVPAPIPEFASGANPPAALSTITVASSQNILEAIPSFRITHPRPDSLDIHLIHPDGSEILLIGQLGTSSDENFDTTRLDSAAALAVTAATADSPYDGYFKPEGDLSTLLGKAAAGQWTLRVRDRTGNHSSNELDFFTGTLEDFSLALRTEPAFPIMTVRDDSASGPVLLHLAGPAGLRRFGPQEVSAGASIPAEVFITNTGPGALTISTPTASSGEFVIDATSLVTPLGKNQTTSFAVIFDPSTIGIQAGTVSFTHNAGLLSPSPFEFDVTGEGVVALPTTATSTEVPLTVNSPAGITSRLPIQASGFISSIRVTVDGITHLDAGQLEIALESPSGVRVLLSRGNGGDTNGFQNIVFFDSALTPISAAPASGGVTPISGTFRPQEPLDSLLNHQARGVWKLHVVDTVGTVFNGTLTGWFLELGLSSTAPVVLSVRDGAEVLLSGAAPAGGRVFASRDTSAGPSAPVTITLLNLGGAVLSLGQPVLGGASVADFQISALGFPQDVQPGGSATFNVAFDPDKPGVKAATIEFTHNDPIPQTDFVINLSGTGVSGAPQGGVATGLPATIPAAGNTLRSTISVAPPVSGASFVVSATVSLTASHLSTGDLSFFLISPAGTRVELSTGNGGTGDHYRGTTFDDAAAASVIGQAAPFSGTFRPEQTLARVRGQLASGDWVLEVSRSGSTSGTLDFWSLTLQVTDQPIAIIQANEGSATGRVIPQAANGIDAVNLGIAVTGQTPPAPQSIFVSNVAGQGLLRVERPLSTGASATDFTVSAPNFPLTLGAAAPTNSASFQVALSPVTLGRISSVISMTHDGTNAVSSPYTFEARGISLARPVTTASTVTVVAIPDNTPSGAALTVNVNEAGDIVFVTVRVSVTHSFVEDLTLRLVHPDGTTVNLSAKRGTSGDNYTSTVFDDYARTPISAGAAPFTGSFRPEQSLSVLDGKPAGGVWRLVAIDDSLNDVGALQSFSLDIGLTPAAGLEIRQGSVTGAIVAPGQPASGALAFAGRRPGSGPSASVPLVIRNIGTLNLNVSNITLTANTGGAFRIDTTGFTGNIAAGAIEQFAVTFEPPSLGSFLGTVSFTQTDTRFPAQFTFGVSGSGSEPALEVTEGTTVLAAGTTLSFGSRETTAGATALRTITVQNSGSADMTLGAPVLGGVNPGEFQLVVSPSNFPTTLTSKSFASFQIAFDPTIPVAVNASVSFTHDGNNQGSPFTLNLTGTGTGTIATNDGSSGGGGGGGCHANGRGGSDATLPAVLVLALAAAVLRGLRRRELTQRA